MEITETANANRTPETILKIVVAERVLVQLNLSRKQAVIVIMVIATLLGFPYLPELISILGSIVQ